MLTDNKIDLKDVTFIIPIRFDSEDRKRNFKVTISFLEKYFDTNIIVMESDIISNEEFVREISKDLTYIFEQTDSLLFHRTKLLNEMTKMSTTDIVVNYDIDVLFTVGQYVACRDALKSNFHFIFPYGGEFYDIPSHYFDKISENKFHEIDLKNCKLFNKNSVGGAMFFNKNEYQKIGLENQKFISWGHEDWERIVRIEKMGYQIPRVGGVLYHLTHRRTHNSNEANPKYRENGMEFDRVNRMNKQDLQEYINSWDWLDK